MSSERRLQELEKRLQAMDAERVSLLREIHVLREEMPKIKCADCCHQKFLALNELAIEGHLRGPGIIGTYAIRADDSCVFLACDFDESTWQSDVTTFRDTMVALSVRDFCPPILKSQQKQLLIKNQLL